MGQRGSIATMALVKRQKSAKNSLRTEPTMPPGLSADAEREWVRVTDHLRSRSALDALDETAIADYVTCWSRLRECEATIDTDGLLMPGDRGLVKNPACQLARTYRTAMLAWAKELGLTFASRTRIGVFEAEPEEANPFLNLDRDD
jgi:P27 family predicted phage terminase small subunit